MKLTVIGKCAAYPKVGEATSCYLITEGDTKVLLDIGSGSLSVMQKYLDLPDLDAVIISHFHPDHYSDVFCLQHAALIDTQLGNRSKPIKIFALEDNFYFSNLNYQNVTIAIPIDQHSEVEIGNLRFSFNQTDHIINGLSIKVTNGEQTLVYTADTAYNDSLVEFAQECTLLLSECTIYKKNEGVISGHMSGRDVGQLASQDRAKSVIITHLPVYGDNEELLKDVQTCYPQDVILAKEGLTIYLQK